MNKPIPQTQNVRSWQRFLQRHFDYSGPIDGRFGPRTEQATRNFQQKSNVKEGGIVGPATIAAAANSPEGFKPTFDLGPDQTGDLRLCRPYFLVPILVAESKDQADLKNERQNEADDVRARIKEWMPNALKARNADEVTDVFVLSHGWHRNLFGGVSAYDRLSSRLALLLRTRRLDPTGGHIQPSQDKKFFPLFLNLHWHSDPGQDGWVDKSGRRHKDSFLQNVKEVFEHDPSLPPVAAEQPPLPSFTEDFEHVFEFFSQISAPGTDALTDPEMNREAPELVERLQRYSLQDDGSASFDEKVVTVWKCYHEALVKRVLLDQDEAPHPYLGFWEALMNLKNFLISSVGVTAAATLLFKIPWGQWFRRLPLLHPAFSAGDDVEHRAAVWLRGFPNWEQALCRLGAALLLLLPAFFLLWMARRWQQSVSRDKTREASKDKPAKGLPVVAVMSWAYAQFWFALPILTWAFLTYPLGRLLKNWHLFDERIGPRNGGGVTPGRTRDFRAALARFAQIPLNLFGDAIAKDSQWQSVVDVISNQLAFYTMQRRGVYTGKLAAEFLLALYDERPQLASARLHFLGHSFGGLVAANAARHLAFRLSQASKKSLPKSIASICLLEGAMASDWFQGETTLGERVDILASIYSRYDTANGYIYPFANGGRISLGYEGMCGVGQNVGSNTLSPEQQGGFASLVRTPSLNPNPNPGQSRVLNVDASRLIYEGSVALGGGHDDIFKDDVIYLLWAVSMLQTGKGPAPPAGGAAAPAAPQYDEGPPSPLTQSPPVQEGGAEAGYTGKQS